MTEFFTIAMMPTASADASANSNPFSMLLLFVPMIALMYFTTIRPQKKQQKMEQQIRENTQIGDEITTIGGICGKVVAVKDDTIVIETGSDRVKIKFEKYAIRTNHTANEKIQAEREAAKAAMQEKKEKKSNKEKDAE